MGWYYTFFGGNVVVFVENVVVFGEKKVIISIIPSGTYKNDQPTNSEYLNNYGRF